MLAVAGRQRRHAPAVSEVRGPAAESGAVAVSEPSELVEMAVVAPRGEELEAARPPVSAPTSATRVSRVASAPWAEVAARPGGRAAGPRYPHATQGLVPRPAALAFDPSEAPVGSALAVDDSGGVVAARSSSLEPGAAAGTGASETDATSATAGALATDGEGGPGGGSDGDDGEGDGSGAGRGSGAGDVAAAAWGKELRARILGDVRVDLAPREGRRVLAHEQATALRVHDVFPRMPEALWPGWRPYIVALEVCVDEEGGVGEVHLLSSAAPRLDQMVAAAARTWRYHPLVLAGTPIPFCHAVVIKYEPW